MPKIYAYHAFACLMYRDPWNSRTLFPSGNALVRSILALRWAEFQDPGQTTFALDKATYDQGEMPEALYEALEAVLEIRTIALPDEERASILDEFRGLFTSRLVGGRVLRLAQTQPSGKVIRSTGKRGTLGSSTKRASVCT